MSDYSPSHRPPAGRPKSAPPEDGGERKQGGLPGIDVNEKGATEQMDRRLFMQLLAFECGADTAPAEAIDRLAGAFEERGVGAVLYEDVNDPRGVAVLTWSENPDHFVIAVRPILNGAAGAGLKLRPELTMLGRTYSSGHEQDLEYWILRRPEETALNDEWPWAVWYPLRRGGAFEKLEPREQAKILKEHAIIGRAYGAKDLAHDIRLACHGLDKNDNEFVIGLIGKSLHPLSHVVQTMRKTRQTSEFIVQMGPFFVGRACRRVKGR